MNRIIVLGAGRVGHLIARDLNNDADIAVTIADVDSARLDTLTQRDDVEAVRADLSNPAMVEQTVAPFDLVIGALPGRLGLQTVKAVIKAQKPLVDISFMPEDPRMLNEQARAAGVCILYDFGVAPGMSNLLIGNSAHQLTRAERIEFAVGGLPVVRRQPWEYQAPFSPSDVIEEYTRPARFKHGGRVLSRPALSDIELFDIPSVGTLEGFLTDGLRSMLDTIDCPHIVEKTLRYPGYAGKIGLLRDSGFLSEQAVEMNGVKLSPKEITSTLLARVWHQEPTDEEYTVLQITVIGLKNDERRRIRWFMLDRTDLDRQESSMARTTGFPSALAARELLNRSVNLKSGVHPPEALAHDDAVVSRMLTGLEQRGVLFTRDEEKI